jgi:hypothetical protein
VERMSNAIAANARIDTEVDGNSSLEKMEK